MKNRVMKLIIPIAVAAILGGVLFGRYKQMKDGILYRQWDVDFACSYSRDDGLVLMENILGYFPLEGAAITLSKDKTFHAVQDGRETNGQFLMDKDSMTFAREDGSDPITFHCDRTEYEMYWHLVQAEGIPEDEIQDYQIRLLPHMEETGKAESDPANAKDAGKAADVGEVKASWYEGPEYSVTSDESQFRYEILDDNTAMITGMSDEAIEHDLNMRDDTFLLPDVIDGHTVTQIGRDAFSNCGCLFDISVRLPAHLSHIEGNPFADFASVTDLFLPDENPSYQLTGRELIDLREHKLVAVLHPGYGLYIVPRNVVSIGEHAFLSDDRVTSLIFPDTLLSVGDGACEKLPLEEIALPESLRHIGSNAFAGTEAEAVEVPERILSLGDRPFGNAAVILKTENPYYKVEDEMLIDREAHRIIACMDHSRDVLSIPEDIVEIGDRVFDGDHFAQLTFNEGLVSIGEGAFANNKALETVICPQSLETIGSEAFRDCGRLTEVWISESVTRIGEHAFSDCEALAAFHVNENNPRYRVEEGALVDGQDQCLIAYPPQRDVKDYTVPDGVCSIADNAFRCCQNLGHVTIPGSVRSIGARTFVKCPHLMDVDLSEGIETIGDDAFSNCELLFKINVPRSVVSIGENFTALTGVNDTHPDADSQDNLTSLLQQAINTAAGDLKMTGIFLYADSYAQQYCDENNIAYELIPEMSITDFAADVFSRLRTMALAYDIEGFTGLFSQFESDSDTIAYWYAKLQELSAYSYSGLSVGKSNYSAGIGEIVLYLSSVYGYEASVYQPIRIGAVSKEGQWQLTEPNSLILNSVYEKYLPQGMIDARENGRNGSLINTDMGWQYEEAEYKTIFYPHPVMLWQNEDGSVDVYAACNNGTEEDRMLTGLHVWMEDETLGTVFDAQAVSDILVPAGKTIRVTVHIPADQIHTGTQKWTRFSAYAAAENTGFENAAITEDKEAKFAEYAAESISSD